MVAIITGAKGMLAYHNASPVPCSLKAFGAKGDFHNPLACSFAGLSAFAANNNHAPSDLDGVICWDAGLDLLFKIAGAR